MEGLENQKEVRSGLTCWCAYMTAQLQETGLTQGLQSAYKRSKVFQSAPKYSKALQSVPSTRKESRRTSSIEMRDKKEYLMFHQSYNLLVRI